MVMTHTWNPLESYSRYGVCFYSRDRTEDGSLRGGACVFWASEFGGGGEGGGFELEYNGGDEVLRFLGWRFHTSDSLPLMLLSPNTRPSSSEPYISSLRQNGFT